MTGPAAEKAAKYESSYKGQNNHNYPCIYNPKFDKGMKEFLKIKATNYFISKIIDMRQNEQVDTRQRGNSKFLNHGYAN